MAKKKKKVAPDELVAQDFRTLKTSERLYTIPKIEDLIFMQSIEGRAHNGAGSFSKRYYVNTTIDDVVNALGRSPTAIKSRRQELIDDIFDYVDSAIADDPRDRLVTRSGKPLLGIPQFKERTVNYHDVLKGLYLGGLRDDPEIREGAQARYGINIGYGKCYLVNTRIMDEMGIDGQMLAHQDNGDRINFFKSCGLIMTDEKPKRSVMKHVEYMYIRHHVGPGQSDDGAIVAAGLLYSVDVALGVFLADAIDTFEKYVPVYRDQDKEIALHIKKHYQFLEATEEEAYELAYLCAIPEDRMDEIPDSSLRYLLAIDSETGQSSFETHLNYIEGKPFTPMAISFKHIMTTKLYDFIRERLASIDKEVVLKVPEAFAKELDSSVAKVMQRRFITVSPQTSLKAALSKAGGRKAELVIVRDENGNILGTVNPHDFLVFLRAM